MEYISKHAQIYNKNVYKMQSHSQEGWVGCRHHASWPHVKRQFRGHLKRLRHAEELYEKRNSKHALAFTRLTEKICSAVDSSRDCRLNCACLLGQSTGMFHC